MDQILFYRQGNEWGEFSNFYPREIYCYLNYWPTSEHCFQAQKFISADLRQLIKNAASPAEAARIGRSRDLPLRADWEEVKIGVMLNVVLAKFSQHEDLKRLLLSTGEAMIIEHTSNDSYWADGGDGSGKNMLGRLLMFAREVLK